MLASIQKINKIIVHPNADQLEIAEVLGWRVVVKKGEFKEGDLAVYIQVDTILPDAPWCEFMRERGFRVRSVKFRKELSQGMLFSLDILPHKEHPEGIVCCYQTDEGWVCDDESPEEAIGKPVQKTLGITKYEKPAPKHSDARGNFPLHIVPITDEERIQNMPHILKDLGDVDITLKHDGTSLTYIRCGKFDGEINTEILCSRKLALKPNDSSYWLVHEKYNLKDLPDDIVVQGELCGPKIQGNKQGLKEYRLYVFNVYSQIRGWYSNSEVRDFCEVYGLDTVRHVYTGPMKWDLKGLLDLADEQKYENGSQAEGIVIRSLETRDKVKPVSFKVISNKFMLKNGE